MRENKFVVVSSLIISIISILACAFIDRTHILYDIFMAVFGSTIAASILGFVSYMVLRRYEMEQYWLDCLEFQVLIENIYRINNFGLPESLIVRALAEYDPEKCRIPKKLTIYKELKTFLRNNINKEMVNVTSTKQLINFKIGMIYEATQRCMESYLKIKHFNFSKIDNSFGKLSTFNLEKRLIGDNSALIHEKYFKLIIACQNELNWIDSEDDYSRNIVISYKKVMNLQRIFKNDIENNNIKCKVSDELGCELEKFRKNIYLKNFFL